MLNGVGVLLAQVVRDPGLALDNLEQWVVCCTDCLHFHNRGGRNGDALTLSATVNLLPNFNEQ